MLVLDQQPLQLLLLASLSFEVGILQPSQSLHPGDMDMSCIRSCSTQ